MGSPTIIVVVILVRHVVRGRYTYVSLLLLWSMLSVYACSKDFGHAVTIMCSPIVVVVVVVVRQVVWG